MTSTAVAIQPLTPGGDLQAYLRTVYEQPVLSPEEERELALRFYEKDDLESAHQLVVSHLRYVVYLARTYRGYGLPEADLIQEGTVGLMKAVKRFDPHKGVRLMSFAVHWIKSEIHEFVLRNWRIVRIATTKAQRKLFFNVRKLKSSLRLLSAEEAKEIADDLGVEAKQVIDMEGRLLASEVSFDGYDDDSDDNSSWNPSATIAAEGQNPETLVIEDDSSQRHQDALAQAIEKLDSRSRDIIVSRWFTEPKSTLTELGQKYNVSAERVRQLESKTMKVLRASLEAA